MEKKTAGVQRLGTRQLTVIGMLSAVSIILGQAGIGFIPLPFAKATIMHIPVIIGAILEGPIVGAMIGLIFGIFSIMQNIMNPAALSFAFINPLVSVLPRVLIGITAYYSYKIAIGKYEVLKIGFGAAIGSLTNTFGVLTMIYLLYAKGYAQVKGISTDAAAKVIYSVALVNGLPEAALAVLVTIPVVIAIKKMYK